MAESARLQLLIFELHAQRCAIPADLVSGIQRLVAMARLPHAPASVEGVVNLRGALVPVVDIRARLGLPGKEGELSDHLIFARLSGRNGKRPVALRVDRALELREVQQSQIEDPRFLVPSAVASGVAKLADGLVVIHDLEAFLSLEEFRQLDRALEGLAP